MSSETPQLENGYLRIAHELFEAILRADFTKRELLVVMAIIRETYGYNRKEHPISCGKLQRMTGISRPHVVVAVNSLAAKKVIFKQASGYRSTLGINKSYKTWITVNGTETVQVPKQYQVGTESVPNMVPKRDTKKERKERSKEKGATASKKPAKGTRWNGEAVPQEWREWATTHENFPAADCAREAEKFADYWRSVPGAKGVKLDWLATWRNWIRNSKQYRPAKPEESNPFARFTS